MKHMKPKSNPVPVLFPMFQLLSIGRCKEWQPEQQQPAATTATNDSNGGNSSRLSKVPVTSPTKVALPDQAVVERLFRAALSYMTGAPLSPMQMIMNTYSTLISYTWHFIANFIHDGFLPALEIWGLTFWRSRVS